MKKILKYMTIVFVAVCLFSGKSYAITKLDFVSPTTIIPDLEEKLRQKIQQAYNNALTKLEGKVKRAGDGMVGEGSGLFHELAKKGVSAATTAGTKAMDKTLRNGLEAGIDVDWSSGTISYNVRFLNNKYANKALDLAKLKAEVENLKESFKAEKEAKNIEMNAQLVELQAKLEAAQTDEEKEELQKQIAQLKADQADNLVDQEHEREVKEKESLITYLEKDLAEVQKQADVEKQKEKLQNMADEMFSKVLGDENNEEEAENNELYADSIGKFFLKEKEYAAGDALAEVKRNRNIAFYNALQDLAYVSTKGVYESSVISDTSVAYSDTSTEADGVYGAMAMRIGGDVQVAKTAARFTELLLAEILYDAASDIVSMPQYKLNDYDKDVTKLDLDSYELTYKDLKRGEE
jgi:hypothetical protein